MGLSLVWVAQNQETAEPRSPLTGTAVRFRYESDEWSIKKSAGCWFGSRREYQQRG